MDRLVLTAKSFSTLQRRCTLASKAPAHFRKEGPGCANAGLPEARRKLMGRWVERSSTSLQLTVSYYGSRQTYYLESHHIPFFKADLFRESGISKIRGWQILKDGYDRRHPQVETRGRKPIVSAEGLRKMEAIIWQYGFQARSLTRQGLANQAGIQASARAIERAMGTLQCRKCIACQKGWSSPAPAKRRVHDAQLALQCRPNPEDWHDIRWTDECHFSVSPGRKDPHYSKARRALLSRLYPAPR
ncbi:hypothetical protein B0T24DRAFT_27678 [Lasiosphaeria ovina]|uniref:Transposase n=1 Tax=Lasiosphaeria ovina TaxID=92902 RepID=A0AAE0NK48_9PEZI|nr:hypothetical protein B0T24DRAFT_27678 [Lasiosphaeria ovina]